MRKLQRYSVQWISGISTVALSIRAWALLLALFFGSLLKAQGQSGLCLAIKDASSGQPLEGVSVFVPSTGERLPSDHVGKVCLTRLFSKATVILEADGYSTKKVDIAWSEGDITILLEALATQLNPVDVLAYRALSTTPVTQTKLDGEQITKLNDGRDIPVALENVPGVVSFSDAGAGIGYTGLRIRGSDPTRINVTINGVTINDAESQGVFWVNMPDLISSVNSIQIQRGVGTSVNGPGAFGASINIETNEAEKDPFAKIILGGGSFNTRRLSALFGTGILLNRWSLDGRISRIQSDGYMDRASSDLQSWMFNLNWLGKKTSFKLVTFGGREITYQAWYGLDSASISTLGRRFNFAGAKFGPDGEVIDFYRDEVDNYGQQHFQLHLRHTFNPSWTLQITGNYTKGAGFYEQFRQNDRLNRYNLPPMVSGTDTIRRTDLIRRLWLDNDLYVGTANIRYHSGGWNVVGGVSYYNYIGDHFGEILWARYSGELAPYQRFYFNDARKRDFTSYVRADYQYSEHLFFYGDLQYRAVTYVGQGIDRNLRNISIDDRLDFFNPKAGILYKLSPTVEAYASIAVANREPARRDYLENEDLPQPETLINYELGTRISKSNLTLEANAYYMDYFNQLVVTGEFSDVGFALRKNVGRSYRTGIEFVGNYRTGKWEIFANLALSRHINIDWKEPVNDTLITSLGNTPIALSAGEIVQGGITRYFSNYFNAALIHRFVGRQYLDNTGDLALSLNPYHVTDIRISGRIPVTWCREFTLNLFINNIFSNLYASNGYVFDGTAYFFPQATQNFLLNATIHL
ncbi:TonB-dependent receptor [Schleiferia thermophila]|uniref:Iron complex outermembrane receptor protein n=1 Tax=Schleiferia thermophila TaxID=884107 RepID=A0A369A6L7_9FLAO|nr:TonB-dependent receptor [Schleiferia thermophila]RCX04919.1 iron complex outermembrane receptor protein [Schleiferia thermophila]